MVVSSHPWTYFILKTLQVFYIINNEKYPIFCLHIISHFWGVSTQRDIYDISITKHLTNRTSNFLPTNLKNYQLHLVEGTHKRVCLSTCSHQIDILPRVRDGQQVTRPFIKKIIYGCILKKHELWFSHGYPRWKNASNKWVDILESFNTWLVLKKLLLTLITFI